MIAKLTLRPVRSPSPGRSKAPGRNDLATDCSDRGASRVDRCHIHRRARCEAVHRRAPGPAAARPPHRVRNPQGQACAGLLPSGGARSALVHRRHPPVPTGLRQRRVGLHRLPLSPRGADRSGGRGTGPRDRAGACESGRADTSEPRRDRHPYRPRRRPRPQRRRPLVVRKTPAPWWERAGHLHSGRLADLGLTGPPRPRARHHLRPPPRAGRRPQPDRRRTGHADPGRPRLRERRRRLPPLVQEARRRRADRGPADLHQGHPRHPWCLRARQLPAQDNLQGPAQGQPRPQPHHEVRCTGNCARHQARKATSSSQVTGTGRSRRSWVAKKFFGSLAPPGRPART